MFTYVVVEETAIHLAYGTPNERKLGVKIASLTVWYEYDKKACIILVNKKLCAL